MLIGNRNVGAERYKPESTARKSLFGVYRNPFTHHPYVQAVLESTANTNVVIHAGELLALKENGPAYEMDHGLWCFFLNAATSTHIDWHYRAVSSRK